MTNKNKGIASPSYCERAVWSLARFMCPEMLDDKIDSVELFSVRGAACTLFYPLLTMSMMTGCVKPDSTEPCSLQTEANTAFLDCSLNNRKVPLVNGMNAAFDQGASCTFPALVSLYSSLAKQTRNYPSFSAFVEKLSNPATNTDAFKLLVRSTEEPLVIAYCKAHPDFSGFWLRNANAPGGCMYAEKQVIEMENRNRQYDALFKDCVVCLGEQECKKMIGEVSSADESTE